MQDKTAFVSLIKENEGLIYKVAKVYTNNPEDEQDLCQDIIYQLWKSFANFRNESKISTWMYRIALNTAIAHLNKEKRKGSHIAVDESLPDHPDTAGVLQQERSEILYAHIKRLDTIEKGIVLLYLEGKTYEEIAAITGFTVTNVGTRLGRINKK